ASDGGTAASASGIHAPAPELPDRKLSIGSEASVTLSDSPGARLSAASVSPFSLMALALFVSVAKDGPKRRWYRLIGGRNKPMPTSATNTTAVVSAATQQPKPPRRDCASMASQSTGATSGTSKGCVS